MTIKQFMRPHDNKTGGRRRRIMREKKGGPDAFC
jgi:hypothetical protein